jgi:hypothetical protein
MTIEDAETYLREQWPSIRSQLLEGTYQPQPVKRVEIPKPDGGVRKLGVPCVVDRLIQQALLQVLQEQWDPTFSEHSYGFRPGRSAHQAVAQAQRYVAEGYDYVVDFDLEKFFDRVNHDGLMARVASRISDKRVLKLTRGFLIAGVMEDGLVVPVDEGTPQGGSAEDYVHISGGSGGTGTTASKNCAVVAYQCSEQRLPPVRRRGSGACQDIRRSKRPCATITSIHSVCPDSTFRIRLNPIEPPWYVARMPGYR